MQIIIALVLLGHGIGHILFAANSWGYWKTGVARSSLFQDVLHADQTFEGIVGILWLIPLIGFVAAAGGYYAGAIWWREAALAAATISTLLLVVWWNSLNTASVIYALMLNLTVITILLWQSLATVSIV